MILEAGATGSKPMARRTRYVDINAILGNEDPVGVLTNHFNNIYTDTPAEREADQFKQEGLLTRAIDPLMGNVEMTKPSAEVFASHPW